MTSSRKPPTVTPMNAHLPANLSSRPRRLWASVGILLILLVLYLSLRPQPIEPPPEGLDKFEHLLAYGVLMFWFAHLEPMRRSRWRLALALVAFGVAVECLQGLVGYRQFAVADMLANGLGVALGWLVAPPRTPDLLRILEARGARARG